LFEFWKQARRREIDRVYLSLGSFAANTLCAPVAVYRIKRNPHHDSGQWLFMQHGSYQWISPADQPHVEEGHVLLYRGIQREKTFRYPSVERLRQQSANRLTWNRYLTLQWSMLSDSTLSFNTIHDRTKRCETAFLNDGTWLADRLAAEAGLDIESDRFAHGLWEAATSAFSLERWVAERKFGPHFVVAKTPIANIRLTTFFAGEAEVRLVDPWRIRHVESVGCTVATYWFHPADFDTAIDEAPNDAVPGSFGLGHEWLKRQLSQRGVAYEPLDNGSVPDAGRYENDPARRTNA
jgi:hypothetical protein